MIEDKDFDLQRDLLTLVMHSTVCTFQNRFFQHMRSHPVIYKIKFIQAYKNGATSLQLVYNNVCVAFTNRLVDLVHALVSLQTGMTHVQHLYTRLYTSVYNIVYSL